jgi:hypothetical protein
MIFTRTENITTIPAKKQATAFKTNTGVLVLIIFTSFFSRMTVAPQTNILLFWGIGGEAP